MQAPCDPAAGCPTVDSDTGLVRAVQIATLLIREPQQNLIYELRTEQQITRISEPDGNVFWDGKSNYFVLQLDADPRPRTRRCGSPSRTPTAPPTGMTMNFNAPTEAPAGDATTTTG